MSVYVIHYQPERQPHRVFCGQQDARASTEDPRLVSCGRCLAALPDPVLEVRR